MSSVCVCVCCMLYLAHPNEACFCLWGKTLDDTACYWYRQPTHPSIAVINFFIGYPQIRVHSRGVRFASHCASVAACLHPLISRQLLMGHPISSVRGTSGNHEARRKKQRGECLVGLVKWKIIVFFCTHEMFHWLANLLSDFHSKWCCLNVFNYVFKGEIVSLWLSHHIPRLQRLWMALWPRAA